MSTMSKQTKPQLNSEDQQQALLFQFVALYERWSEDRQVAAKQGYDLAKLLEQFSQEVERFSVIEEAVIVKLRKSLNETVVNLSEKVNGATTDVLNNTLGSCVNRMDRAAKSVEVILSGNKEIKWLRYLKVLALNVVCSLVASGFVVWLFMPQPTLPLTADDMTTYLAGKKILALWATLPKEKQQRIVAMMKDQEPKKSTPAHA
jgi:hypothetical protein